MIKYRLNCGEGHHFDEWFNSMADFDAKAGDKAIPCPDCGNTDVAKAIMAPNVAAAAANNLAAQGAPAPAPCGLPGGGCGAGMCGLK